MEHSHATTQPSVKTGMLIRRPVHEVYEAFVNPEITTKFWFTKSSSRLDAGKEVTWEWEMYGVSSPVTVQAIEANQRILIEWPGYSGPEQVEWNFAPLGDDKIGDDKTFVTITNRGFVGEGEKLIEQLTGASEAWTMVLAGLKALLEHNVQLGLIADRFPEGLPEGH